MKSIVRTVQKNEINQQKIHRLAWRVRFSAYFFGTDIKPSEPKEEEVSQTKPNEAEQAQIKPSDATDSHAQPNEAQLSSIKPKQAKDSKTQPSNAIVSESKPKKLKQAKEVQRLIEQGDVSGALAEAGLTKKKIPMPESHQGVASGDGKRSKRITILMSEEERKYINREARRHGMTIGQFVYALAVAAAEGKIELEDFLED